MLFATTNSQLSSKAPREISKKHQASFDREQKQPQCTIRFRDCKKVTG